MPKHDVASDAPPFMEELDEARAERVENIAKILAEHLYAKPEDDDVGDNALWEDTSEENKRIYRSCALDIECFLENGGHYRSRINEIKVD